MAGEEGGSDQKDASAQQPGIGREPLREYHYKNDAEKAKEEGHTGIVSKVYGLARRGFDAGIEKQEPDQKVESNDEDDKPVEFHWSLIHQKQGG